MAYLKHVIVFLLPCMFLASVSCTCTWVEISSDAGTTLPTDYPSAPACVDTARIASYDDVFAGCVTSCKGKANCKMVIAKQKPLGNTQSSCSEFSAICTSLGSPCTNCPTGIDYAAVCTDNSGNNANNGSNPGSGSANNGTSGNSTDDSLSDNSASSTSQGITVFAAFICVLLYIIN